jgi:hypothetical protein
LQTNTQSSSKNKFAAPAGCFLCDPICKLAPLQKKVREKCPANEQITRKVRFPLFGFALVVSIGNPMLFFEV